MLISAGDTLLMAGNIDPRNYDFATRIDSIIRNSSEPHSGEYAALTPEMLHEYDSYCFTDEDGKLHQPPFSYEYMGEAEFIGQQILRESDTKPSSTLEIKSQSVNKDKAPDLHFVYWYHAPYNVHKVLPELESADVILLESPVSWSRQEKAVNAAWINKKLGAELSDRQQLLARAVPFRGLSIQPLYKAISERFAGSGKTVRLIDVNATDEPSAADNAELKFKIAHRFNERVGKDIYIPNVVEVINNQYQAFAALAMSASERDHVILKQIESARKEFADKEVAVIYGNGHTQLSYAAMRGGYGRRTFVDGTGSGVGLDGAKIKYNLAVEIVRRLQFDLPVSEDMLLRSLLQSSLTAYLAQARGQDTRLTEYDMEQWDQDTADLTPKTDKIARGASSEDIEWYAQLINNEYYSNGGDRALHNFVGELAARA